MSGLRASILVAKSQNVRAWVCKRGHERTQGLNFVLKSKKRRAWASEKRAWGSLTFQNYSGKSLLIFCTTGSEVTWRPRSFHFQSQSFSIQIWINENVGAEEKVMLAIPDFFVKTKNVPYGLKCKINTKIFVGSRISQKGEGLSLIHIWRCRR